MAADRRKEARTTDRVPVSYLIKLDCPTRDEFEKVYALNLSRGGMFIHSHNPQPLGTTVQFEIQVADGTQVLRGQGVVRWVRNPSPGQAEINPGMGIQFTSLDGEGGTIIDRILAERGKTAHACGDLVATEKRDGNARPSLQAAGGGAPGTGQVGRAAPQGPSGRHDRMIGIDLGTTYSCVATVINGRPMVIPSRQGYRTLPSVVAINEKGKLLVGHPAREQILINPRDTVYGAKRLIGRKFDSPIVADIKSRYAYEITEGKNGEAAVSIAGRQFSLQEISALILTELREIAQIFLGTEVRRAVVTVPAFYNEAQRQAVREAGALAGLEVERILSEPTAAALAFGFGRRLDKRLMIYDLGGGTFDVSILDVHGDVFEVVSTGGDTFLGGGDFDNRLVDLLADGFLAAHGIDLRKEKVVHQRVLFAAENAKCRLSEQERVKLHVPFVAMNGGAPLDLVREVSRSELETATSDLVDRTVITCDEVLGAKAVPPDSINEILLVGGQSRMPLIWRKIRENFSREPHKGVHPDEAVACGAALLADSLSRSDSLLLVDVLSMSIGIKLPNGRYSRVVPRNTPLPAERNFTIATSVDRQTSMSLPFYQGESDLLEGNEFLGILKIEEMPSRPRGQTRCRVDLTVTQESLLQIKVSDISSGTPLNARFDGTSSHRQALNVEVFGDEPVLSGMVQTGVIPARSPEGGRRGVLGRLWSFFTRRRP